MYLSFWGRMCHFTKIDTFLFFVKTWQEFKVSSPEKSAKLKCLGANSRVDASYDCLMRASNLRRQ
jgi:hypothetical protein